MNGEFASALDSEFAAALDTRDGRRVVARGIRIETAIERDERVTFVYRGERREVSAYELRPIRRGHEHRPGDTIREADIVGWDHGREGIRTFKLSTVRRVARRREPRRPAL